MDSVSQPHFNYHNLYSFQLTTRQGGFGLKNVPVSGTVLADKCPQMPSCRNRNNRYRTIDGSCNNPNNHAWGMSNMPNQRIMPPTYEDGVFHSNMVVLTD